MAETIVKNCSCAHEFQDLTYGKGKRLHNPRPGGGARCTVCGSASGGSGGGKKIEAKKKTR
jgi:hypothetical protein